MFLMNYHSALLVTEGYINLSYVTIIFVSWLTIVIQNSVLVHHTYHIP